MRLSPWPRVSLWSIGVLSAFTMLWLGACNDDSAGGGGGSASTLFIGTVVGGTANTESGSLVLFIEGTALAPPASLTTSSAAPLTVTGNVNLKSPTAGSKSLTGTYDPGTDLLDVSGGGYAFSGGYDGAGRLEGTYAGPNGPGSFVTLGGDSPQAYCGSFSGDDDGIWNFVVNGTVLAGTALSSSGAVVALDGNVAANDITIVNPSNPSGPALATGTIAGATATGLWDNNGGESGSWTGTAC